MPDGEMTEVKREPNHIRLQNTIRSNRDALMKIDRALKALMEKIQNEKSGSMDKEAEEERELSLFEVLNGVAFSDEVELIESCYRRINEINSMLF